MRRRRVTERSSPSQPRTPEERWLYWKDWPMSSLTLEAKPDTNNEYYWFPRDGLNGLARALDRMPYEVFHDYDIVKTDSYYKIPFDKTKNVVDKVAAILTLIHESGPSGPNISSSKNS